MPPAYDVADPGPRRELPVPRGHTYQQEAHEPELCGTPSTCSQLMMLPTLRPGASSRCPRGHTYQQEANEQQLCGTPSTCSQLYLDQKPRQGPRASSSGATGDIHVSRRPASRSSAVPPRHAASFSRPRAREQALAVPRGHTCQQEANELKLCGTSSTCSQL